MTEATQLNHSPSTTAKDEIHAIAKEHGITPIRTDLDAFAAKITELSDDDVTLDDTEMLLVWFGRKAIMDETDIGRLHLRYLKARDAT